ncbi:MAG: hypothetical protein LBL04_07035 [Bacteroidales bacterium]|jgi:hypothetical protein|nr:hypothetical protein [Bacteroidales bacterium]
MKPLPDARYAAGFPFGGGLGFLILFFTLSCSRNDITTDPSCRLGFSADTIRFDTVFTTLGSATHRLMVYNPNKQAIRTSIALAGGSNSPFRLHIDGLAAESAQDVKIAAMDSLYIFVEVTIDPQNSDLPVVTGDSILFETNANRQRVRLEAYGQDVYILRGETIGHTTWTGSRPYLVYGRLTVDTLKTLHIEAGVHVYLHQNADIHVKGSLVAEGTADQPIVFAGDRLEKMYRDIPGQWGSIIFGTASRDNRLHHAEIRNGTNGLIFGNPRYEQIPAITLDAVAVMNMSNAGITVFAADVDAVNCLAVNCGSHVIGLFGGGTSRFVYCTVAGNYSPYIRRTSTAALTVSQNYADIKGKIPGNVFFGNSIVYGTMSDEIDTDGADACLFDRCLLRTTMNTATSGFSGVLTNSSPVFAGATSGNFRLKEESPARDTGDSRIGASVTEDMDGNNRIYGPAPDMGAYEWRSSSLQD